MTEERAILALADGTIFEGISIGASGEVNGEIVFNTSMTGYQEILTDPSYAKQIVTLTYPHIGNTGTNTEDKESDNIWSSGLVVRSISQIESNWRKKETLSEYLIKNKILGISNIDTRKLTRIIRNKGNSDLKVAVFDFGIKKNILRILADRGYQLRVFPAETSYQEIMEYSPDGVFLSNGPGDPEPCTYAIETITQLSKKNMPLFGICLGHQLLALSLGGKTSKMKFGHHGANHPVQDLKTMKVAVSSQNHGFTVEEDSLPDNVKVTHKSLFDGTIQGIEHESKPFFSFQGHPEASPGPHDLKSLFNRFEENMNKNA